MIECCLVSGPKVMFRVALVLIRSVLGSSHQLAECPGLYEILDRLRHIPPEFMEQEYLVKEASVQYSFYTMYMTTVDETLFPAF